MFFIIIDDGLDVRVSLFLGQLVPIDPRKQIFRRLLQICQILEIEVLVIFFYQFLLGVVHVFIDIDQISRIIAVLLELIYRILAGSFEYLL